MTDHHDPLSIPRERCPALPAFRSTTFGGLVVVLLLAGCITSGPVEKGPYPTSAVQKQAVQGIDNNAKIAVRAILAKYSGKQAQLWASWEKGDAKLQAKQPLAGMTTEQLVAWSNQVGEQRIRVAQKRDNMLATYAQTRMEELTQVGDNTSQSKEAILNIVATWKAQGEASQLTMDNIASIFAAGVSIYQEYQHIRQLRDEAKEAADKAKSEAAEMTPEGPTE